jgi:hypothetical protein
MILNWGSSSLLHNMQNAKMTTYTHKKWWYIWYIQKLKNEQLIIKNEQLKNDGKFKNSIASIHRYIYDIF